MINAETPESLDKIKLVEMSILTYGKVNGIDALLSFEDIGDDFWITEDNRNLFKAMKTISDRKQELNVISISIENPKVIREYALLGDSWPVSVDPASYINQIRDWKKVINFSRQIKNLDSIVSSWGVNETLDNIINCFQAIVLDTSTDSISPYLDGTAVEEWRHNFKEKINRRSIQAMSTGIEKLDTDLSGGIYPGSLYTVAARPSIGKTALALNMAVSAALEGNFVSYFSNEMSRDEIINRINSMFSRVEYQRYRDPKAISKEDLDKIRAGMSKMANLPLAVHVIKDRSWSKIESKIRSDFRKKNLKVAFIDYIQQYNANLSSRPFFSKREEIEYMTGKCKQLAIELNIAVVILAQLNREIDKMQGTRPPILSDLKESGAIEQDSDVVLMLYADGEKATDPRNHVARKIVGTIAKNRNGKLSHTEFFTEMKYNKFYKNVDEYDMAINNISYRVKYD